MLHSLSLSIETIKGKFKTNTNTFILQIYIYNINSILFFFTLLVHVLIIWIFHMWIWSIWIITTPIPPGLMSSYPTHYLPILTLCALYFNPSKSLSPACMSSMKLFMRVLVGFQWRNPWEKFALPSSDVIHCHYLLSRSWTSWENVVTISGFIVAFMFSVLLVPRK